MPKTDAKLAAHIVEQTEEARAASLETQITSPGNGGSAAAANGVSGSGSQNNNNGNSNLPEITPEVMGYSNFAAARQRQQQQGGQHYTTPAIPCTSCVSPRQVCLQLSAFLLGQLESTQYDNDCDAGENTESNRYI
jgi:hypothetical protein